LRSGFSEHAGAWEIQRFLGEPFYALAAAFMPVARVDSSNREDSEVCGCARIHGKQAQAAAIGQPLSLRLIK
jgi:hypothetical protein